jgi:hypothetical protein
MLSNSAVNLYIRKLSGKRAIKVSILQSEKHSNKILNLEHQISEIGNNSFHIENMDSSVLNDKETKKKYRWFKTRLNLFRQSLIHFCDIVKCLS